MIERSAIEAAFSALHEQIQKSDWNAFVDLFSEDCSFLNSALPAPVRGRENLRSIALQWPRVTNVVEWTTIDGNRLSFGWNERQEQMSPSAPPYRGISTFVFDSNLLVAEYEGMFDLVAMSKAVKA